MISLCYDKRGTFIVRATGSPFARVCNVSPPQLTKSGRQVGKFTFNDGRAAFTIAFSIFNRGVHAHVERERE
jgi:hypothetical protein